MTKYTCCFTGHRHISPQELPNLTQNLTQTTETLIRQNIHTFLCGGAIGFDILAGQCIITLKEKYPHIKLIMILPCREQYCVWSAEYKAAYRKLLTAADEIIYISEKYYEGCMKKRNIRLVSDSEYCIAYLKNKKARGNAKHAVRLAVQKGIRIFNLAD